MKEPKRINLNLDQVDTLLKRVENGSLQEGDYEIIKAMAETIYLLSQVVDEKATSIRRLLKMLFGAGTEKLENVIKNVNKNKSKAESLEESPENKGDDHVTKDNKNKANQKPKGHGRNGASDYTGAEIVDVFHSKLKSGANCPACLKGKLYESLVPAVVIRITGKPPLHAKVYQLQRLRCNLCGEIFKADAPEGIGEDKYDEASGAMIALLKYGAGMPFNRIQQLQAGLGIPLPASTQWDIVEQVGNRIYLGYEELIRQAAQGDVIYNDDTTMKILTLIQQNNAMDDNDQSERKGIFTTGIVSTLNDRKIALFFTGRKHAGENINDLLKKRQIDRDPPIQMCDALYRNIPKDLKTILANCLSHGRRKFVDVTWNFPEECRYVIETLAKVYKNDKVARKQNMSADERLKFHQIQSGPLMEKLKTWFKVQFDQKKIEPNSGLGQAISYMQNHWKELTLFLQVPKAPLDNNLCERALKKAILHRKNAMFYKTEHGAYIGDMFMSLIHTCNLNNINPYEYLISLQKHSSELLKHPEKWLPWSYDVTNSSTTS